MWLTPKEKAQLRWQRNLAKPVPVRQTITGDSKPQDLSALPKARDGHGLSQGGTFGLIDLDSHANGNPQYPDYPFSSDLKQKFKNVLGERKLIAMLCSYSIQSANCHTRVLLDNHGQAWKLSQENGRERIQIWLGHQNNEEAIFNGGEIGTHPYTLDNTKYPLLSDDIEKVKQILKYDNQGSNHQNPGAVGCPRCWTCFCHSIKHIPKRPILPNEPVSWPAYPSAPNTHVIVPRTELDEIRASNEHLKALSDDLSKRNAELETELRASNDHWKALSEDLSKRNAELRASNDHWKALSDDLGKRNAELESELAYYKNLPPSLMETLGYKKV
jgi:hypothetical protein